MLLLLSNVSNDLCLAHGSWVWISVAKGVATVGLNPPNLRMQNVCRAVTNTFYLFLYLIPSRQCWVFVAALQTGSMDPLPQSADSVQSWTSPAHKPAAATRKRKTDIKQSVTIFSIFHVQGWVEALWHTVLSALKVHHHFWAAAGVTKLNTLWNKVLLLDVTSPSKWHPVIFLKSQTSKIRRFILPGLRHSYEESSAWFRDILMPVDRSTDQHLSGYRKIQYTVYLYIVYYILIQKYKYTVKHFEDGFVFS